MNLESVHSNTITNRLTKTYNKVLTLLNRFYIPIFILLSGILFFMCFHNLGVKWVDSWDEARHGVNAYEMLQNNSLIVNTYNYSNDYWNLKPPLSYWGIMLGFQIFGYKVAALRFYSAFSYFLTCVIASLFVKRYSPLASLFTMSFFCASGLAFISHMARAGDADALYTMFFTFAMLAMLLVPENKKMLYLCGFFFAMAFLTKSWHAGVIVIIGGIYLLVMGELKKIKPKEWLFFILSFGLPLIIWCVSRYMADGSRFFVEMYKTDLLNRTKDAVENHNFPFAFYYQYIFNGSFKNVNGSVGLSGFYIYKTAMILCFIGAVSFSVLFQKEFMKKILGFLLWFFIPFVLFSIPKTKLIWYVYPTLIPLSMVAGIMTAKLLQTEQILYKVRFALFIVVALLLMKYTNANIDIVQSVSNDPDPFQQFIAASITREDTYTGATAYVYLPGDKEETITWTQANLFMGEISGDYHCTDGGLDAFLADPEKCVLYISNELYKGIDPTLFTDCEVLFQNDQYTLLGKTSK